MSELLVADSIAKRYGERAVLSAATLRARVGEITLLIGRSGAGKTTLLRIAAGTLDADHGIVTFKGAIHERPRWHALARSGMYYLPDRELLSPSFTVGQHLAMIARQFASSDTATAIELCGIGPWLDRKPDQLSTGERRRVELATAIARAPDCLLADEPYRNVDPIERDVVSRALRHLAANDCAVVITGHEVADLLAVATHVTWCTDGTTYELGTPDMAGSDWRFCRDYLGQAESGSTGHRPEER